MSVKDSQILRECPFCGGEANTLHRPHVIDFRYSVGCNDDECRGFIGLSWLYKTEAEAIAAWNSRAERTCHIEHPYYNDAPVINGQPRCSECKTEFSVGTFPNYCPNCGVRVIA